MTVKTISYGLDFGTTNSTVAYIDENNQLHKVSIDPLSEDTAVMRSVIYASPNGQFLFGNAAVAAYLQSIVTQKGAFKKTIYTGKYITINDSQGHDQVIPEIIDTEIYNGGRLLQSLKSALSSTVIETVNLFGKAYSIEELIGIFLKELKDRADQVVGRDVSSVIIGRPVEYAGGNNTLAVKRMTKACELAGFRNIVFEYESIGAAYDYGIDIEGSQNVLVFDFGGGTLDISVVKFPEKKVLMNAGLPIGGDKFNAEIFMSKLAPYFGSELTWGDKQLGLPSHIFISLQNWYEISLLKTRAFIDGLEHFRYLCSDHKALEHLKSLVVNSLGFIMYEEIERTKKKLSIQNQELYKLHIKDLNLEQLVAKGEFERMIEHYLVSIHDFILSSLSNSGLTIEDIDYVTTTGGSSLIPVVQNMLIAIFGKDKIIKSDTFTGVASGLAKMKQSINSHQ